MASIHRDPRFPKGPWFAAFTLAGGRRVLRSTKTKSRAEAKIIANAWETAEREAAHGDLSRDRVAAILNETLTRLGHSPQERISVGNGSGNGSPPRSRGSPPPATGPTRRLPESFSPTLARREPRGDWSRSRLAMSRDSSRSCARADGDQRRSIGSGNIWQRI